MSLIIVKPADGLKMPMEGNPRKYITEPTAVESSHYYRKAIQDGDLVIVSQKEWQAIQDARVKAEAAAIAQAKAQAQAKADAEKTAQESKPDGKAAS